MPTPEPKTCVVCGRTIEWRRKWARNWHDVKYCSDKCRRSKPGRSDTTLEQTILSLLESRAADASICPSEAARAVFPDDWRQHMQRTRDAARRLAAQGALEFTQGGKPVDPSTAKGPVRLRRPR